MRLRTAAPTPSGRRIGHYDVIELLGAGGMGEVYRARDTSLRRQVAIKIVRNLNDVDANAAAELIREARHASALNHPNVCTVYQIGEFDGQPFIAMECVEGENLEARLANGRLTVEKTLALGRQIAAGLEHAHQSRMVHGDLKSLNVMVTPGMGQGSGLRSGPTVRSADLSNESTHLATEEPRVPRGTISYMAPELEGAKADFRSDIWALGVLMYQMASGERPFAAPIWRSARPSSPVLHGAGFSSCR